MGCGFISRGNDAIGPVILCPFGVPGVHNGRNDFAAIFMGILDQPVSFAEGEGASFK